MITESVDIMKQYRIYPHERFALRRLVAGTLSASSSSSEFSMIYWSLEDCPYMVGSVVKKPVDMITLSRNIQFIAEVLAHFMFNLNDSSLVLFLYVVWINRSLLMKWVLNLTISSIGWS